MEERITIAAVGDIFLGGRVEDTINKKGSGYIFDLVKPFLCGNDVVVGNLESPISEIQVTDATRDQISEFTPLDDLLIAKPTSLDELKEAGFNALSIANNHTMDFGLAGLRDTILELEKRNIGYAGAGLNRLDARRPLRNVGGKNVTFLAYYGIGISAIGEGGGPNKSDVSIVLKDIRNAHNDADIVLVSIHWGRGTSLPMKHQVEFAHQMVDHGANVIVGSGPHVLQPVEQYNGGVIAYSLGNFVFDFGKWSMILHVSFTNGRIESVSVTPVCISAEYRPEPIDPDADPAMYEKIRSLLVQRLDRFESDAEIVPTLTGLRGEGLTPLALLKKIVLKSHRAYPLSLYLSGLWELLKERWFSKH